ncbi:MAG: hypothetical protein EZS28_028341, partial [Streblomastix strix]
MCICGVEFVKPTISQVKSLILLVAGCAKHRRSATDSHMNHFLELAKKLQRELRRAAPMEELLGQAGRPLSQSYRLTCSAASH